MNLYYLDRKPELLAEYLGDRDLVQCINTTRLIIDTILALAGLLHPTPRKYIKYFKTPHVNWARSSLLHYRWVLSLANASCREYQYRFKKQHKLSSSFEFVPQIMPFPSKDTWIVPPVITPMQYCVPMYDEPSSDPDFMQDPDDVAVNAYRLFYVFEKHRSLKWTKRYAPPWVGTALDMMHDVDPSLL